VINRLANATRLVTRIYVGYALVGGLALVMLALPSFTLQHIGSEFGAFSGSSERYRDGLQIAGAVADMQRAVQAYIFQGHPSAAEQVDAVHGRLRASLDDNRNVVASPEDEYRLAEVNRHLATYYRTFLEVRELRRLQTELVEERLPAASVALQGELARLYEPGAGLPGGAAGPEGAARAEVLAMANELLRAEASAYRYFDTLVGERVVEALEGLGRARDGLGALSGAGSVTGALDDFERLFLAAVQRTRGYTYLVNVVLAAEAYEMLYQAQALAALADGSMAANEAAIGRIVPRTLALLGTSGALLLLLIVALAWLVGESIAQPIRRMTATFRQLASGAGDAAIPVFSSGDQLSELSRAAGVFRDRNNETESLLARFQALSESLERQVAARTEELEQSNEKLRTARDAAEAAAKAKSEFLANMSHEIRTPVHALQGQLQLLENSGLSDAQKEYARQAWVSNKTLSMLLNDILDFSKIDAGRMELEAAPVNLCELLEELEALFRDQARTRGLVFEVLQGAELPEWVRGDATRLTQVLLNLLSNALKFTAEGRVTLRADLTGKGADGRCALRFEVEDTGVGIPADKLELIFEEFTQAEGSTTRSFGGTGLGLTISRRLVALMGGELSVVSEPGRGACFTVSVTLPELDAAAVLAHSAPSGFQVDLSRNDALTGRRILLTEDNPSLQKMTRLLLEQQSARVVVAGNGREALDALEGGDAFDVVLMDMQMPVLGGVDATRAIRQQYTKEQLPVIAMTANATREDREAAAAVGMNDFLAKPLDFRRLVAALQRHLGMAPAAAPGDSRDATRTDVGEGPAVAPAPGVPEGGQAVLPAAGYPAFDLARALARMAGQTAVYAAAAQPFLDGHAAMLEQLAEAVAAGDDGRAAHLSHEIKGSASLLGAEALLAAASAAERAFLAGPSRDAADRLLVEVCQSCHTAVDTLRRILAHLEVPTGTHNAKGKVSP
jgi:signal transduction histidine kinase/HPt (histidine-containing phosphotransfer) domain-containing protein/ActR/RegA family two-component response regulator